MIPFTKAHAYGNDFVYALEEHVVGTELDQLARALCDRHRGVGADGLMVYSRTVDGAAMRLLNADGSPSEVSGNGVRGLAAILLRSDDRDQVDVVVHTIAGDKRLRRTGRAGTRQTFVAAMGLPRALRQVAADVAGERLHLVVMDFGNPQCVTLGELPDPARFERLGPAIERHELFPARTNVEFVHVEDSRTVRILIWERGVGPTEASGTGACAAAVAAMLFGGASRDVNVVSPGGSQRVEWRDEGLFLTGWAELIAACDWGFGA